MIIGADASFAFMDAKFRKVQLLTERGYSMADDASSNGGFFSWAGGVINAAYQAVTRDGAIGNSLIRGRDDLAAAFGQGWQESVQSNATGSVWDGPVNQEIHLTVHGSGNDGQATPEAPKLPTPSEIAKDNAPSFQVAEVEKTWVQKELDRERQKSGNGGGGDQSELERARILPIEQLQEKDTGRGR